MNKFRIHLPLVFILLIISVSMQGQSYRKVQHQPYADQKLYHLGFFVSLHTQDMVLSNTGNVGSTGQVWFADIPSYSPGFSVGIIGDKYLNEYFNLRLTPTLHFGEKKYIFKEQASGEEYKLSQRSNYISLPLHVKFSGGRIHNARPYLLAGAYASMALGSKKDQALRFKQMDYGLDFGVGCNIYLPLFKLCPELRFSLGLVDIIDKDRSDLTNTELLKYREAISSGKTRMISLVFNFE